MTEDSPEFNSMPPGDMTGFFQRLDAKEPAEQPLYGIAAHKERLEELRSKLPNFSIHSFLEPLEGTEQNG